MRRNGERTSKKHELEGVALTTAEFGDGMIEVVVSEQVRMPLLLLDVERGVGLLMERAW